ncbi:MAG: hypothetical protein IJL50_04860 [Bacteroidaceae bacterium]|nr:hypothetical protein [Bacteroidaceae bacterium]
MGYFQLQQLQHCNRIGGNGAGQNLLKCRWIRNFTHKFDNIKYGKESQYHLKQGVFQKIVA